MQFSDLKPGVTITAGRRKVTEEEIVAFATRYDPQWFHIDPVRATKGRWQGLIASGWMTCSLAMQLAVHGVLADSESFGSPGVEELRWPAPLRPGDVVELRIEVLERHTSRSGRIGSVRWRWLLTTQSGTRVLELVTTSLFELRR
jgi:acyl dehydratase